VCLFIYVSSTALSQFSKPNQNNVSCDSVDNFIERADLNLGCNIILSLKAMPFDSTQHTIKRGRPASPFDKWEGVILIDDKPVFGTDWEMPKYILLEAQAKVNGEIIPLDVSCMYDPWFNQPDEKDFSVIQVEGGFLISGIFSDGAGRYKAQWLIIDNASVRTMLVKEDN
jgi:hypothetical protein